VKFVSAFDSVSVVEKLIKVIADEIVVSESQIVKNKVSALWTIYNIVYEKSAQRDANTARALAVVRFGHRPPVRCHKPTDRTDYNALRRS